MKNLCVFGFLLITASCAYAEADIQNQPAVDDPILAAAASTPSALATLIQNNQDYARLNLADVLDNQELPLWLKVHWRKQHPDSPPGVYPRSLMHLYDWMLAHPNLQAEAPEAVEFNAAIPQRRVTRSHNINISGVMSESGKLFAPSSESDIRIDFHHPEHVVAASNTSANQGWQRQYYSWDGGLSWGYTHLPLEGEDVSHSDPAVDWTADGVAWATTLGSDLYGLSRLKVYKSINAGRTWRYDSVASGEQTAVDKPMLWVDHSDASPHKDTLYAVWSNYHTGSPIYVARRPADSAAWEPPIRISGKYCRYQCIGADITTNAVGEVFAIWPDIKVQKLLLAKSSDGGASYTPATAIASTYAYYDIGVPAFNKRRALIYATSGAYANAVRNEVYLAWTDLSGEAGCTARQDEPGADVTAFCKTRIWFTRSSDGGLTWSDKVKIQDLPDNNDQFNPKLAVDATNGRLSIVYLDTVRNTARSKTDVWYQSSMDGGMHWSKPLRVTDKMTDETTQAAHLNQYGDYMGLSGYHGTFIPSWTDRRDPLGHEQIWSAIIRH